MWLTIINFLSSPHAPYVFCGILGLVFLYGLFDGWSRLAGVRTGIRRARAIIESIRDTQGFYTQFETVSDQFSRQPIFAQPWSEFSKTVIIDPSRELVRITRRPQDFFHEISLLAPRLNLRQYSALPGYLISLGLFFTFIGLVAAIAIAAQGLGKSTDVVQTQAALVQLLDVASLKFISSVAGISLSVILSFLQKAWLNRAINDIHRFCETVEARTQLVTTEQLLHQWLVSQEQTTRSFAHLAEDIATEVTLQLNQGQ
jgi:hypothetical protein